MLPPSRSLVVRCTGYGLVGVECEALTIEIEVEDVDGGQTGRKRRDRQLVRSYLSICHHHPHIHKKLRSEYYIPPGYNRYH